MRASELFQGFTTEDLSDCEIRTLTENTAHADRQTVFVCIRGARHDGHDFAPVAYEKGCRIFVAERAVELPADACVVLCQDTTAALGRLACRFYGHPSRRMHLIGITGTKGKTTTAQLLAHILNTSGIPCGYIGSNGVQYRNIRQALSNTTPDAVTLQSTLRAMLEHNVHTAVIEVSSQALLRNRVSGTHFETVLFTNLSPDHIGVNEHTDFDNYKSCKHRLFTDFGAANMIFNADDPASEEMLSNATAQKKVSISVKGEADYSANDLSLLKNEAALGVSFSVTNRHIAFPVSLPMTGVMNAYNALLALATAAECFDIRLQTAVRSLSDASVCGRGEIVPLPNGACAIIDYAHNGDSMRQLLTTLREYHPRRLIALFGSVGGRSEMRRMELGSVAAELCDLCVLTSDNPANEDPTAIIADIAKAFEDTDTPYLSIPDRADAIRTAVELTTEGDILVLAGKGHENYQLIGNQKIPFCEREILSTAIKELV